MLKVFVLPALFKKQKTTAAVTLFMIRHLQVIPIQKIIIVSVYIDTI